MKKQTKYIIVILFCTLLAKELTGFLDSKDLYFILFPLEKVVYLLTGIPFQWVEEGFKNDLHNIIIDKSCSGISFMIILFSLLLISLVYNKTTLKNRFKTIIISLVVSYVVTVLVNSFRIILSIKLIPLEKDFHLLTTATFHQVLGGIIYLFFLLIIYHFIHSKIKTI